MAKELDFIEKKLAALKASKEKEENKSKELIDKLTNKFNEDSKNLKATFDSKVNDSKKDLQTKLAVLNPEISFYEKQRDAYLKLMKDIEDHVSAGKKDEE